MWAISSPAAAQPDKTFYGFAGPHLQNIVNIWSSDCLTPKMLFSHWWERWVISCVNVNVERTTVVRKTVVMRWWG